MLHFCLFSWLVLILGGAFINPFTLLGDNGVGEGTHRIRNEREAKRKVPDPEEGFVRLRVVEVRKSSFRPRAKEMRPGKRAREQSHC